MTKAKEPIKIWAKPLKNGNKALYLRRYIAGSQSKGYVYEKLEGLFLIDDKRGKDKSAKERNNQALQVASLIKCERIKEYMNEMVGIKKKTLRDMLLKDWMQMYADRKSVQGQSGSNAATIHNTMLHLIIYKGENIKTSQIDKAYCEGFVAYLANAMTIGFDIPKRGQHHQKKLAIGTARLYFNTFVTALNEAVREGVIEMIKTKQIVMVPLSENALVWMPSKGIAKMEDFVFSLPSYFTINSQVKQWAKSAGLEKKITFHMSRHTFATTLLTMGADLYTTSKLLGHQNIKTTQVYAEIVNKKKIETVNLLDKI